MAGAGSSGESCPDLDRAGLEQARAGLAARLRRVFNQSNAYAAEMADEMIDQAYVEYAEKPRAEVVNLVGLLITIGVSRAIDKARREGREVHGDGAQALIENREDLTASTEALAVSDLEAVELHEAVDVLLTREQRQVLALYYWEGLSTRKAATAMGLSHMTFCRRRDAAIARLREGFGLKEPGAETGAIALARARAIRRRRGQAFHRAG